MRAILCQRCQKTAARNDSLVINGVDYCLPCSEEQVKEFPDPEEAIIQLVRDPSICSQCGEDGDQREWAEKYGYPVCPECTPGFGQLPFPPWIKLGAVGLAVLLVLSFVLNFRFWQAKGEVEQFWPTLNSGEFQQAEALAISLGEHVPEVSEFQYLAHLAGGMLRIQDGRNAEAVEKLEQARIYFGDDLPGIDDLVQNARTNLAFDEGDYDEFLILARQSLAMHPGEPWYKLGVASALACQFAHTGDESSREECKKIIEECARSGLSQDAADYVMRIEYRLYARDILDTDEFYARYPEGWINPERSP